ncbi:MAG: fumarylacetoacetate hydrolase family protein [Acidobacteriota bacterium]|nr:fumarylacetoacetate hydrolase family protein [Acidobacteriota bacterium]
MYSDRRTFLKSTAAGVVSATTATLASTAPMTAQAEAARTGAFEMPRNMTLLNLRTAAGPRLGVKLPKGILDVAAAATRYQLPAPVDTDDLLQNGKGGMLATLVAAAADGPASRYLQESAVQHAPLVTRPEKIIMMGFNYRRHAAETGTPIPANPTLFNKFNNTLNHHGGTIVLPTAAAKQFDHEIELVIVFGRECRNVSEADALNYVAGYCTGNDFSARDLQYLTSQFMIGKTFDGFAPLGPHLVTSDLVGDPNNLRLECRINGEQRQDWNTNDMIFNCRQLISFASRMMTIKPGDIMFTGTPHGVIFGKPKGEQVWLKPGDRVACSVEKLGELAFSLT